MAKKNTQESGEIQKSELEQGIEEEQGIEQEYEVPEEPQSEFEKAIAEYPAEHVSSGGSQKEFEQPEIDAVVSSIVTTYGISKRAAFVALTDMIRRGGHATSVPPSFNVEIYCVEAGRFSTVYKRDIVRFMELQTNGRKSFKNLAQTLARSIIRMGIYRMDKATPPNKVMVGDLAKKIDNKLAVRKEPPLSNLEKIGCASYAQHLPELDTLCCSDRLKHLLAEDLESRRKGSSGRQTGQQKGQAGQQKGQKKGQQKGQQKGKKNK
jgi:hypothetical protein